MNANALVCTLSQPPLTHMPCGAGYSVLLPRRCALMSVMCGDSNKRATLFTGGNTRNTRACYVCVCVCVCVCVYTQAGLYQGAYRQEGNLYLYPHYIGYRR